MQCLRFDWFLFDTDGVMKKPDTADFVLGDFKLSPGAGSLAPSESVKICGTFTATEPKNWQRMIGIYVPGMAEDAPGAGKKAVFAAVQACGVASKSGSEITFNHQCLFQKVGRMHGLSWIIMDYIYIYIHIYPK